MQEKYEILIISLFYAFVVVIGCTETTAPRYTLWYPNDQEVALAKKIAQQYASSELGISKDDIEKMKIVTTCWRSTEGRMVYLQLYNPERFPNWETMVGVFGCFPNYFAIEVNMDTLAIHSHYASPK